MLQHLAITVVLLVGLWAQPVGAQDIHLRVEADAPGNDHENLNGEWVELTLVGTDDSLVIAGWTLCDAARHCYTFPEGSTLRPNSPARLFTGSRRSDAQRFFMGRRRALWNNRGGDTATLRDESGTIVAQHSYW